MERIIDDKEIIEAIELYGADAIKELTKQLLLLDKKASGKLIKSLDYKVLKVVDNITLQILSEPYLQYVDQGRRPGSFPPVQAIARWCKLKGINVKAAWPISYKIYKFGIKPTNVIEKTVQNISASRAFNKMEDQFSSYLEEKIEDLFVSISKKGNIVFRR